MLRFLGLRQSRPLFKIAQFNLADIGEGITECEIIKWFVTKGQKVSQFDPLCEVQSDKAAVEISSRYDGVIAAIHYSVGDMGKFSSRSSFKLLPNK